MSRKTFLSVVSMIAVAVGSFALLAPAALLDSKGVAPSAAGELWAREVGIALLATGILTFLVRAHTDSPTLRAFFIASALLQLGLFPIEIAAYLSGTITKLSGILPNEVLHVVLAVSFTTLACRTTIAPGAAHARAPR